MQCHWHNTFTKENFYVSFRIWLALSTTRRRTDNEVTVEHLHNIQHSDEKLIPKSGLVHHVKRKFKQEGKDRQKGIQLLL